MVGIPASGQSSNKNKPAAPQDTLPLLREKQVYFNLAGAVLWQASDYGELEFGGKINIRGKYFPVIEAGLGLCNKQHDETDIHFKTKAPFIRIGCDKNFAKDKTSTNRIYGGLRFGYTSFSYDVDAPTIQDPYWTDKEIEFKYSNVKSNAFWAEFVFGLETSVWQHLKLGWTARYKRRLHHTTNEHGSAWYIPGYGENSSHNLTGTFNVIYEF